MQQSWYEGPVLCLTAGAGYDQLGPPSRHRLRSEAAGQQLVQDARLVPALCMFIVNLLLIYLANCIRIFMFLF